MNILYTFLFIVILQLGFFTYATIKKTDKVTDLSYGLTFVLTALFLYILNAGYESYFKSILIALVSIWGLRLSIYLFVRIIKIGKDKRFDGVREDFVKFFSFWILQAVSIFVILLPVIYVLVLDIEMNLNPISSVGLIISLLGIAIETVADYQKFVFKNNEKNRGKWICSGLWKYSRHPNYLGEIMMWLGVFLYCSPYINNLGIFTAVSPIYITLLLIGVSGIPTLEREYEKKYAGNREYEEYVKSTGILFPKVF